MKNRGLGILALLVSLLVFISPAQALEDMNGDGAVNVLDLILSQNPMIVPGDTNADSDVNIIDLATVGLAYGSQPGDSNWNPGADVANTVDKIDIFDLATVGLNYNKQPPEPLIDPIFNVSPASSDLNIGENGTIDITIETVPPEAEVYAVELKIYFDPAILDAEAVTEGDFLQQGGVSTFTVTDIDNTNGIISFASTRFNTQTGASGSGILITLIMSGEAAGASYLNIDDIMVSDPNLQPITLITAKNGTVNVNCISHQSFSCYDDDVYWYNSCGSREDKKEDCGSDSCDAFGADYCNNGDVYHSRTCYNRGCSGDSCFANPYSDEELVESCTYGCDQGACLPPPECNQDSDCGTDGLVGSPACSNNDVYQDYRTYTCNNPGTQDSFCSHTDTPQLQEDCGTDTCDAFGANYCNNGDVYHSRTCYDRGCSGGSCFTNPWQDEQLVESCTYGCDQGACLPPPACMQNSDCGQDGWVGGLTCSNDDVYQDYRTYTCNNPGTQDSFCSYTDVLALKQDCGSDYCDPWGQNYCNNGDVYHSRTCYDLGCSAGSCYSNPYSEGELVEECPCGCSDGECLPESTINIPAGVSIFSLPLGNPTTFNQLDTDCSIVMNGGTPSLAYYQPNDADISSDNYVFVGLDETLYPGQGYFIKVVGDCYIQMCGDIVEASDIGYLGTKQLKTGWNLAGAPTYPTAFNAGTCQLFGGVGILKYGYDVASCLGVPGYNGGYEYCTLEGGINRCRCEVDNFEPGLGYWIRTKNDCTLA